DGKASPRFVARDLPERPLSVPQGGAISRSPSLTSTSPTSFNLERIAKVAPSSPPARACRRAVLFSAAFATFHTTHQSVAHGGIPLSGTAQFDAHLPVRLHNNPQPIG